MSGKKKNRKQDALLQTVALLTAILNLLVKLVELIHELTE